MVPCLLIQLFLCNLMVGVPFVIVSGQGRKMPHDTGSQIDEILRDSTVSKKILNSSY